MKTRILIVWVLCAFCLALGYSAQAQGSGNNPNQQKIESLRQAVDKLQEAKDKIQAQMDENPNLPEEARDALKESVEEIDGKIAELKGDIAELQNGDTDADDDDENSIVVMHKNDTVARGKSVEIENGYIKIRLRDKDKDSLMAEKHKKLPNTKTQILGLDLGENFLLDQNSFTMSAANKDLELSYPKSINVTLYLLRQGVNLIHHKLYTTAGIAIDYHDYRFKNNITLQPNSEAFSYYKDTTAHFSKNKLSAHYLMVPITLNFESNPEHPNKSFKLSVGGYGEMLIKSYTKQVSEERGKQHFKADYNLNNIAYGLTANIGYGSLQFYTHYSLAPLLEKNTNNPELYPVTFGLVVNGFKWRS